MLFPYFYFPGMVHPWGNWDAVPYAFVHSTEQSITEMSLLYFNTLRTVRVI